MSHNRFVKTVATDSDRVAIDDPTERYKRDLGRATANIDNHTADRFFDLHTRTDRGCHRLFDQSNIPRSCTFRRSSNGLTLNLG